MEKVVLAFLLLFSLSFCAPVTEAEIEFPGYPYAPVIGDVDKDDFPEIVVGYGQGNTSAAGLMVLRKYEDNSVDTVFHWRVPIGECYTPYLGDVDNDGHPEIVVQFWRGFGPDSIIVFNHDFSILWRAEVTTGITTSMSCVGGHAITAGDIDDDGTIEVLAATARESYIRVFDGATGNFIRDIRDDNGKPYGAITLFDLDGDKKLEVLSCWSNVTTTTTAVRCFYAWNGSKAWEIGRGFSYAVANIDLDPFPDVVIGYYEGSIYHKLYTFDGSFVSNICNIGGSVYFPHFGLPVIAQFDTTTPEAEFVFAINHITGVGQLTACYTFDGRELWRHVMSSGEFNTVTGADLNCDLIPEIAAYNFDTTFFIIDGSNGHLWATFTGLGTNTQQVNNMIPIVDVDLDFHSEFVYNGQTTRTGPYKIRIVGDDTQWNPTRPIWNEGGFYYTSIEDNLELDDRKYTNWRLDDENIFRCQLIMPCGLGVLLRDSIDCAGCMKFTDLYLNAKIVNTHVIIPAPNSRVRIEVIQGEECVDRISGAEEIYLGNLLSRDSIFVPWVYSVDGDCPEEDIIFRIYASSSDSVSIAPTSYDFIIELPNCVDFPIIENVRPLPCGGVMTCPDSIGQMLLFYVTSEYYPISYENIELTVNGKLISIDSTNFFHSDDYLAYVPDEPFKNGDVINYWLNIVTTTVGCTTQGEPCSVIVDIQAPIFFNQYPSENSNLNEQPDEFSATLMDSIAGVKWSSLDGTTARVSSLADTMDIPVTYLDGVVTVNLSDIILIGPVEICFAGIEDDPTIDYCAPNVLDTCFHFSVRSRTVAEQIYPDSGIYTACTEGVLKMLLYHRYDMDDAKIELEINDDVILGTDPRICMIAGEIIVGADDTTFIDTLIFAPGAGYWQDSTWYEIRLLRADDVHGSELTEPIEWGFWTDFAAPSSKMIEPQDSLPIYNVLNEIIVELEDGYSGIDSSSITFTVNGTEMDVSRLNWLEDVDKLLLRFEPKIFDYQYAQSDTISVVIEVCDKTDVRDYCGANCAVHEFQFFTAVLHECERFPNPFTPNGDGVNDYVQFFYPDFELKAGDIYIYSVSNKKVRELHIPAKQGVSNLARWDGTDKNGNLLPQGVYLYVIKVEGEVMCEGTVTIAR